MATVELRQGAGQVGGAPPAPRWPAGNGIPVCANSRRS